MRAWLYDTLTDSTELQSDLGGVGGIGDRVLPRRSQQVIPELKPFVVYGLGNSTAEGLGDSTAPNDKDADRQFFQVWVHDDGGSFTKIDTIVAKVIKLLHGAGSPANGVITVIYLETSAEFSSETYGTNFRYIRFQAVKVRGGN
jgi:hypothetical protein